LSKRGKVFYADFSSLLPVSPSYYDRRFPAAAKADAGKARTPLKNYLEVYFMKKQAKTKILSCRVTPEQR